jgi:hypothetical protein
MHKKTQNAADLRLCSDADGMIWFTTEQVHGRIHTSELTADEWVAKFVTTQNLGDVSRIRIFGTRANAELICALYEAAIKSPALVPQIIQIGSPAYVPSEHRNNPERLFALMDDLSLPTSCGGWHDMTAYDHSIYQICKSLNKPVPVENIEVAELLKTHPAYPALSFFPSFSPMTSALMVDAIVDPRWFVDPVKPDRTSRLRSYMGMQIDTLEKAFRGEAGNGRIMRAKMTFGAWSHGDLSVPIDDPRNFLFRILRDTPDPSKALLRACVRYLSFVRNVWLHEIAPKGRTLFVPEYFFDDSDEALAYRAHVQKLGSKQ